MLIFGYCNKGTHIWCEFTLGRGCGPCSCQRGGAYGPGAGREAELLAMLLAGGSGFWPCCRQRGVAFSTAAGRGRGLWPCCRQRGGASSPGAGRGAGLVALCPAEGSGCWPCCWRGDAVCTHIDTPDSHGLNASVCLVLVCSKATSCWQVILRGICVQVLNSLLHPDHLWTPGFVLACVLRKAFFKLLVSNLTTPLMVYNTSKLKANLSSLWQATNCHLILYHYIQSLVETSSHKFILVSGLPYKDFQYILFEKCDKTQLNVFASTTKRWCAIFSKFAGEQREQTCSFTKENFVQIKQLKQKNKLWAYPPLRKEKDGNTFLAA